MRLRTETYSPCSSSSFVTIFWATPPPNFLTNSHNFACKTAPCQSCHHHCSFQRQTLRECRSKEWLIFCRLAHWPHTNDINSIHSSVSARWHPFFPSVSSFVYSKITQAFSSAVFNVYFQFLPTIQRQLTGSFIKVILQHPPALQ